jgi:hypothetical protein
MTKDDDQADRGLGYALGQLWKALRGGAPGAERHVETWEAIVAGLTGGTLRVGERTPVAGAPAWVTLEVAHGGFATGRFAAGGPLELHEAQTLAHLPRVRGQSERLALNTHFVGDEGRAELEARLADGRYRVHLPEEGALLVAAWLLARGERERAARLLETLLPFFDRLRFYPVPAVTAERQDAGLHVQTVAEVRARLERVKPKPQVVAMNATLAVWTSLRDRALALFVETIVDGTPCRRFADDWRVRAEALLADDRAARRRHPPSRRYSRPRETYPRLLAALALAVQDPARLDDGVIRRVATLLRESEASHGPPGGERERELRARQARMAARPQYPSHARVLHARLAAYPADEGIPDVETLLHPLVRSEADELGAAEGEPLPAHLATKVRRAKEGSITELAEAGLIASGEMLARTIPPLTARLTASGIADPALRRLVTAVQVAFRGRRSLLLVNLARQVQASELPWLEAVAPWALAPEATRAAARLALAEVVPLAIARFPHAIVPNKLVKELRALKEAAGVPMTLVDEIAADIFQGAFGVQYLVAAKVAAERLRGTIYERYYGLDHARVLELDDSRILPGGATVSPGFAALCEELAAAAQPVTAHRSVARNGAILEQAQILTTHNLASLVAAVPCEMRWSELATRTFAWVRRRSSRGKVAGRLPLATVKNLAYAWRQMIFYLAMLSPGDAALTIRGFRALLDGVGPARRTPLLPALAGLEAIAAGERFDSAGHHAASGGRRLLGWTTSKHWMRD